MRGHGRGRGRGRATGTCCGIVAPVVNELPNGSVPVNENSLVHNEEIEEEVEFEYVEEVKNEEEVQVKATGLRQIVNNNCRFIFTCQIWVLKNDLRNK